MTGTDTQLDRVSVSDDELCALALAADPEVVADAWAAWRAEVDFAERFVAEAPSLDITGHDPLNQHGSGGGPMSLREVVVGMIEEYARHLGHADLLRERIDGRMGQ